MKCYRNNNFFSYCLGVLFWGLISIPAAAADISLGLDYLDGQQTVDGSYSNAADISTEIQATSEALRAFRFAGGSAPSGGAAALGFLDAETYRNTEHLSRLIVAHAQAGDDVQSLADELIGQQNSDGGFGDFQGYESTVLDTAFALEALAVSSQSSNSAISSAVYFLLNEQLADGGWACAPNESTVYLSALAMRALWYYRTVFPGVDNALAHARDFLLAQRDIDTGLWSETFESALALIALIPNATEFSQVESIVDELRARQQADGSWDNSVYATALAVRAIASQPMPVLPSATVGAINGKVLDSDTRQPIAGATVTIQGTSVGVVTDLDGEFLLEDIDPATYDLQVKAAGYSEVSVTGVTVNVGSMTVLGDTRLTPLPTSGILQGQVSDAGSGQALAGVTVSVTGTSTASTQTAVNGSYSLTGLNPGDITITLTLNGYLPVTATGTIAAGNTVVFNPALTPSAPQSVPLPGTPSTGLIRGVVTDANTDAPLASARIVISDASTGLSISSKYTYIDGSYEFAGLEPGAVTIQALKSGYLTMGANATVKAGNALTFSPAMVPETGGTGDVTPEPLPPTPTTGVLKGAVTDAGTGSPLASVLITVDSAGTGARLNSVFTGADGAYEIKDLEPGDIVIQAGLAGYQGASATGTVQAGNALVFNPALVPEGDDPNSGSGDVVEEPLPPPTTGTLRGVVSDAATGSPLEAARIAVDDANTGARLQTAFTAADGSFEISDLEPGDVFIQASKTGYLTMVANAAAQAGVSLVFNPALEPEGDNLDGDVEEEPMPETPTTGALQGVVTDIETGLPLGGATVDVTGSFIGATVTLADGSYSVADITPGDITVAVSLAGYLPVSASGSVAAGNAIVFSPALTPEEYVGSDPGHIVGRVVEAGSREPLRYVVVDVSGDSADASASTGIDGRFEIHDLPPGNYAVGFTISDYIDRTLSVVVTSGGTVDMQDVELGLAQGTASVFGQITDTDTGAPIGGAVVSIMGTAISVQTDDDGNYRIEGLEPGNRTLTFSATGYNRQTLTYGFSQPGDFEINRSLTLTENSGLNLTFLSTDRSNYDAYMDGEILANVLNNGSPIEGMVVFSLFDENGGFVGDFTATRPGEESFRIVFTPGVIESVAAPFHTANLPPGAYRIVGRVVVGNQTMGPATAILDERTAEFVIDETEAITRLSVDPLPAFSAVGVTETIRMLASVVNRSNVPITLYFRYSLRDPGGGLVEYSELMSISLTPDQDSFSQVIDTFSTTFAQSGEHPFDIAVTGSPDPDTIEAGMISVAPGLRIDPSQEVTPSVVTPDENQRVRIHIRLEGREVQ